MDPVTEFKVATDAKFNSILKEIQFSKLNFAINLTPFAAYITLKRTTHPHTNCTPSVPSPPTCLFLQQSSRDLAAAREEILHLKAKLSENVKKYADLNNVNAPLLSKLSKADEKLTLSEE